LDYLYSTTKMMHVPVNIRENVMKICQMGADLFQADRERHMDGQMDGQTDMTKLRVHFRSFTFAPNKYNVPVA
jgi:hypothetical protein